MVTLLKPLSIDKEFKLDSTPKSLVSVREDTYRGISWFSTLLALAPNREFLENLLVLKIPLRGYRGILLFEVDSIIKIFLRAPLLIPFGIPTQVFFSDTRHQKRSLASLNEYFGNAVAGKKPELGNKMELLEAPLKEIK